MEEGLHITVRPDVKELLKDTAEHCGMSQIEIASRAISEWIKTHAKEIQQMVKQKQKLNPVTALKM